MNARHTVPLILVVVASAGALLSTTGHHENARPSDHHHNAIIENHTNQHHHELDHHDDVAVGDMLHHAATRLDTVAAIPNSYFAVPDWKPSWELRWLDFQRGDHAVRLYHVTDHNHPEMRFIVAVDDADHGTVHDWIPVQ